MKKKRNAEIKAAGAKVEESKGAGQGPVSELVDLVIGTAIKKEGEMTKKNLLQSKKIKSQPKKGLPRRE